MNTSCLRELDGNTWLRRRRFQQVSLFQQFHLSAHLIHEGGALDFCGIEQSLLSGLPIVRALKRNRQNVEAVFLRRALFDQGISKQKTVGKDHGATGVEMRCLTRPDFQQLRRKDVVFQDNAPVGAQLDTICLLYTSGSDPTSPEE